MKSRPQIISKMADRGKCVTCSITFTKSMGPGIKTRLEFFIHSLEGLFILKESYFLSNFESAY